MIKLVNNIKFIRLLSVLCLLFLSGTVYLSANNDSNKGLLKEEKNVLYISSYSPSFETFFEQIEGINKRFEGQPITLDVEFMDSKRFNVEENIQNFYNSIQFKINHGLRYDAILVADDNGLDFVMVHKDELFANIPIFFLGINDIGRATKSSKDSMVTGVLEEKSYHETIQFAYDLNPSAKQVVCIIDNTPSSLGGLASLLEERDQFPELEFITMDTSKMTLDEYAQRLSNFNNTDLVIYVSAFDLKDGKVLTLDEVHKTLRENSSQPVYSFTINGIGKGTFGGKVISHVDQGYAAADMVMQYFNGTAVEDIPFVDVSPNRYVVDYELFENYHFDENKLPEDTVFINRVYTIWERYHFYILLAILVILGELLIIFFLIRNTNARKKSEDKLRVSKQEIQVMNEELKLTVEALHSTNRDLKESINEVSERDLQIREMIYIDELTGLMTRYAFKELLAKVAQNKNEKKAVMILNIDNFKNINDTFGHAFGDQVIQKTGERLTKITGESIDVSRFGGDEFVVLLHDYKKRESIDAFCDKIHSLFEDIMVIDSDRFFLTVSIGIALYPEQGTTYEELMKHADVALHEAKKSGKDTHKIYTELMDSNVHDKIYFQNMLRSAFKNEEFYLHYQPLVSIYPKKVYGFEALIRWKSEELGQVSPYKLITEAEEMGLIIKIGEWIIREACLFTKKVNQDPDNPKRVSINISAVQLMYNGFFKYLVDIVEELEIRPENICLEMTETILIEDLEMGSSIIKQLGDYGFKIGLDDFGTGYSSLSYLKNLSINTLKIDKSFVDNIAKSSYDLYLVEAIIKIAKEKNIIVVAEGVEYQEQFEALYNMKCRIIQGYLFSKPLSLKKALLISDEDFNSIINKMEGE